MLDLMVCLWYVQCAPFLQLHSTYQNISYSRIYSHNYGNHKEVQWVVMDTFKRSFCYNFSKISKFFLEFQIPVTRLTTIWFHLLVNRNFQWTHFFMIKNLRHLRVLFYYRLVEHFRIHSWKWNFSFHF